MTTMTTSKITCIRCDGTGYISKFAHYASGACFECGGTGKMESRSTKQFSDGGNFQRRDHRVVKGNFEWVFRHFTNQFDNDEWTGKRYARPDSVILTVIRIKPGKDEKKYPFNAALSVENARKAWVMMEAGRQITDITNTELGLPEEPACSWTRESDRNSWDW